MDATKQASAETTSEEARRLIGATGMSVEALSKATGIHRATLFRITRGDTQTAPSGRTMDALRRMSGAVEPPAARLSSVGPEVRLERLPDGQARLVLNQVLPFSVALQILALIEGDKT